MNLSELAKAMNVTEKDVTSLINMVVTSMKQDKIDESNLGGISKEEIVAAYIQAEVKKFSNFCVTLLINQEKRSAFTQYMLYKCA